jgi:hypothetical protein
MTHVFQMGSATRFFVAFLLVLPPLVSGCVDRHRTLYFGTSQNIGNIPLSASWEGTTIQHFALEGIDAKNYFATFRRSPADEMDQAMLRNLSGSGLFASISRGQYQTDLSVWGEIRRFTFTTSANLASGLPGCGLCSASFPQVKLTVDIEAAVHVALATGDRRAVTSAVINVTRDKWVNVALNKKNLAREASEVFEELGEKLKGALVGRRYTIMEAMGDRPRRTPPRVQARPSPRAQAAPPLMSVPLQSAPSVFQVTALNRTPRVAVMDLEDLSETIPRRLKKKLTKYIRSRMSSTHRIEVIDRTGQADALKTLLKNERKEFSRDCSDKSCQIELGKSVTADYILRAELDQIGTAYTLSLEVVDLAKEATIGGATVEFLAPTRKKRAALADRLTKAIRDAVGQL